MWATPIAHFDPTAMNARQRVLMAEVEALTQLQRIERQERSRRFERDREAAGLELGALRARVEEGQARITALYDRLAIDERLFAEGVVPRERAQAVRREIEVVETRVAADRNRLALARRNASKATGRAAARPGTNQWQIEAARRELLEVETRIEHLSLTAPLAGQISQIYRRPGAWLQAGERLLRISPVRAAAVDAWLDQRPPPGLHAGISAQIRSSNGQRLLGRVTSIGVERLQLPPALWARADAPEWGYPIRIAVEDGELAPGEPVLVGLHARQ